MERPLNHHYREPGTELDSGRFTREQEAHAALQISRGLQDARETGGGIDASTARLIAAALHSGAGSHLEQFASTGALNPAGALEEIGGGGRVQLHHIPWVTALWDFLEQINHPDPDRPEAEHDEPEPLIYVQAHDPDIGLRKHGAWLNPRIPTAELAAQMEAVADLAEVDGATPKVTATVGFHQLRLADDASPAEINSYARGVASYGEPYALLAQALGVPVDEKDFLACHEGSYDSMTDFIAHSPAATLDFVRENSRNTHKARTTAFDDYERVLRKHYLCLDGREGVHVFRLGLNVRKETA